MVVEQWWWQHEDIRVFGYKATGHEQWCLREIICTMKRARSFWTGGKLIRNDPRPYTPANSLQQQDERANFHVSDP